MLRIREYQEKCYILSSHTATLKIRKYAISAVPRMWSKSCEKHENAQFSASEEHAPLQQNERILRVYAQCWEPVNIEKYCILSSHEQR